MDQTQTTFVLVEDTARRERLRAILQTAGLNVQEYSSVADFLGAYDPSIPGCLIVDADLSEIGAAAGEPQLAVQDCALPVIVVTELGDVEQCARAFKVGAFDYIVLPIDDDVFLASVRRAIDRDSESRAAD